MSTNSNASLNRLRVTGVIECPKCRDFIRVYAEVGEPLDEKKPIRCPECRIPLNDEARKQLGWKR